MYVQSIPEFRWDKNKAATNLKKHGVYFADAVSVFEDDLAFEIEDDRHEEKRFIRLGMDAIGRHLVVVYTWRGNNVRIISARKATRRERKQYEEGR
jgi:uncharacterized DUF497 family protein